METNKIDRIIYKIEVKYLQIYFTKRGIDQLGADLKIIEVSNRMAANS